MVYTSLKNLSTATPSPHACSKLIAESPPLVTIREKDLSNHLQWEEGRREGGRERGREGEERKEREGERKEGRKGGREGERERGREGRGREGEERKEREKGRREGREGEKERGRREERGCSKSVNTNAHSRVPPVGAIVVQKRV